MRIHYLIVPALALALVACGNEHQASDQQVHPVDGAMTPSQGPAVASTSATPADNAARNAQDDATALTPLDQGDSAEDIRITRQIRQGVVADGDLSTDAQNIKIITRDGHVVLRGPVKDATESAAVYQIAVSVAGVQHVDNRTEPIAKPAM